MSLNINQRTWEKHKAETVQVPEVKKILATLLEPGRLYRGDRIEIKSGLELKLLVSSHLLELLFAYEVVLTEKMYQVISILLKRLERERAGTYTPTALYNMLSGHIGASVVFCFYQQANLFDTEN